MATKETKRNPFLSGAPNSSGLVGSDASQIVQNMTGQSNALNNALANSGVNNFMDFLYYGQGSPDTPPAAGPQSSPFIGPQQNFNMSTPDGPVFVPPPTFGGSTDIGPIENPAGTSTEVKGTTTTPAAAPGVTDQAAANKAASTPTNQQTGAQQAAVTPQPTVTPGASPQQAALEAASQGVALDPVQAANDNLIAAQQALNEFDTAAGQALNQVDLGGQGSSRTTQFSVGAQGAIQNRAAIERESLATQLAIAQSEFERAEDQRQFDQQLQIQKDSLALERKVANFEMNMALREEQRDISNSSTGLNGATTNLDLIAGQINSRLPGTRQEAFINTYRNLIAQGAEDQARLFLLDEHIQTRKGIDAPKTMARVALVDQMEIIKDSLNELDSIGVETGLLKGGVEEVFNKLGATTDPRIAEIAVRMKFAVDEITRQQTGAALNADEQKFYNSIFPSKGKNIELNNALIDGMVGTLRTDLDSKLGFAFTDEFFKEISGGLPTGPAPENQEQPLSQSLGDEGDTNINNYDFSL